MKKLGKILCLCLSCLLLAACSDSTITGSGKGDPASAPQQPVPDPPPEQAVDAVARSERAVTVIEIETVPGDKFVLTSFTIDYTDYPFAGFYTPRYVSSGIFVHEGERETKVSWTNLQRVEVRRVPVYIFTTMVDQPGGGTGLTEDVVTEDQGARYDEAKAQYERQGEGFRWTDLPDPKAETWVEMRDGPLRGTLTLSDGETLSVILKRDAKNGITGKTKLGETSVRLRDVRSITPVKEIGERP